MTPSPAPGPATAPATGASPGGPAPASPWRQGGWHAQAQVVASPNFSPRPPGATVDLAIVHAISLPPGVYGGPAIEQLFTNRLDPHAHPSFAEVAGLRVSAHFVIRRDGELLQCVGVDQRAWHAGVSTWRGRPGCNDYSVGIELEGLPGQPFEAPQYDRLARLLDALAQRWPVTEVTGHEHVAPGRKTDPGPAFDWSRLATLITARQLALVPGVPGVPGAAPRA